MLAAGYSFFATPRTGAQRRDGDFTNVPRPDQAQSITGRELDDLRLLARGYPNTEISRGLTLSESPAKSHIQSLLTKLCLRNRVSVVIYAYEKG